MKVYVIGNLKGGVGKTTTTVNLAYTYAEMGGRTLVIDLDPQCNCTRFFAKVNDFREEFGHWEMDTVVGPQGKSKKVMLVLTERKTRKEIVYLMPDRKAQTVVKTLNMIERKCGERLFRDVFKTITVDNGVEFSDAEGLEKSRRNKKKRTKVYYCHPYSSCERGSNENANRLIRRHIPKGVNFDKKSKTEIKEIETWINNYPRKIFEYDTAENQFINEMEKLTG